MSGSRPIQLLAVAAVLTGAVSCAVATVATIWAASGTTPAWIFDRSGSLRHLRSASVAFGIPIEFFGAAWFTVLSVLVLTHKYWLAVWRVPFVFVSAVLLAGFSAAESWRVSFANWTMTATMLASLVLLVTSAFDRFPTRNEARGAVPELGRSWSLAWLCVCLLVLTTLAGSAFVLRQTVTAVSPQEAAERNFVNWYASRPRSTDARLRQEGRIRVVAFTDYQCPFCATRIPRVTELVDRLTRSSSVPIELIVHDFPLDAECNRGFPVLGPHPAACEAAAAVRFLRETTGTSDSKELVMWLYEHQAQLTRDKIRVYLRERGLADSYVAVRSDVMRRVAEDVFFGLQLGVDSTPTLFVEGVRLPAAGYLETAITFESERRGRRADK